MSDDQQSYRVQQIIDDNTERPFAVISVSERRTRIVKRFSERRIADYICARLNLITTAHKRMLRGQHAEQS